MTAATTTTSAILVDPRAGLKQRIAALAKEAEALGAIEGPKRLLLVDEHLEHLAPQEAYAWIDPEAFRHEIEAAQERTQLITWLTNARNLLTLAPLIVTWTALAFATSAYQADLQRFPDDARRPFLQLWQEGFRQTTPWTFTRTAFFDVILLLVIIAVTFLIGFVEGRDASVIRSFSRSLQSLIDAIMREVSASGAIRVSPEASVEDVANAVQRVIDRALKASQQVVDTALQGIDASNNRVSPLLQQFTKDMGTLQQELSAYQGRLGALTTASTDLATAAKALESNAGAYTNVATAIQNQVASLDRTQQQLGRSIDAVAKNIGTAAHSVETVAAELTTGMRSDIELMTENVTRAAETLRQVELQLEVTTKQLDRAATNLATVRVVGGGLFGWLLNTRGNRGRRGEAGEI